LEADGVSGSGALGMSVLIFAPFAFMGHRSVVVTIIIGFIYSRNDRLPDDEDAATVYGEEPEELPPPHLSA
jgi:hypothetical protein